MTKKLKEVDEWWRRKKEKEKE